MAELAFLAVSLDAGALLGCGFDDGKAAASRRTPKCPRRAAVGWVGRSVRTAGWNLCPRNKKCGREAAAIGKIPHSYPESRVPNEVWRVKEFLGSWLVSDWRVTHECCCELVALIRSTLGLHSGKAVYRSIAPQLKP